MCWPSVNILRIDDQEASAAILNLLLLHHVSVISPICLASCRGCTTCEQKEEPSPRQWPLVAMARARADAYGFLGEMEIELQEG